MSNIRVVLYLTCQILCTPFHPSHGPGEPTAQRVCDKLLRESLRLGTRDNVSVLAVRFCWTGLRAAV